MKYIVVIREVFGRELWSNISLVCVSENLVDRLTDIMLQIS